MAGSVFNMLPHNQGIWDIPFPRYKSFSSIFGLKFPRIWICSAETLSKLEPQVMIWNLPAFASVMPESPQTMISLVANYAAGITTLPRKPGLHYCRAATQNILWCQEMPATELFFWTVSWKRFACSWVSSTQSTRPNKYFRNFLIYLAKSHQNSAFKSQDAPKKPVIIGLRKAHSWNKLARKKIIKH